MRRISSMLLLLFFSTAALAGKDDLTSVRDLAQFRSEAREKLEAKPFSACGQVISKLHNEHYPVLAVVDDGFQMYVSDVAGTNDCRVGDVVALSGHANNNPRNGLAAALQPDHRLTFWSA